MNLDMAKTPKPPKPNDRHKLRLMGLRLPDELQASLRALAAKNRRTLTAEIQIALEKHLADHSKE